MFKGEHFKIVLVFNTTRIDMVFFYYIKEVVYVIAWPGFLESTLSDSQSFKNS
jgi:hypothetical protein